MVSQCHASQSTQCHTPMLEALLPTYICTYLVTLCQPTSIPIGSLQLFLIYMPCIIVMEGGVWQGLLRAHVFVSVVYGLCLGCLVCSDTHKCKGAWLCRSYCCAMLTHIGRNMVTCVAASTTAAAAMASAACVTFDTKATYSGHP